MAKYRFIKDSKLERPRNISHEEYVSASYGQEFICEVSGGSPWDIYHFSGSYDGDEYKKFKALKNIINFYSAQDQIFNYNELIEKPISMIALKSYYLGSGLVKGSIAASISLSGSYIASATDFREDGVLYDQNDNKVGLILYNEGFIFLNNTESLSNEIINYGYFQDHPRWIHASISPNDFLSTNISYNSKNDLSINMNFVYLDKNKYNHSNNETYLESGSYYYEYSTNQFIENSQTKIKNTIKSPFVSGSANFEKQTFISKIGLYDKDKNLIAIGSLASPIKKIENREFVFKLKIDI